MFLRAVFNVGPAIWINSYVLVFENVDCVQLLTGPSACTEKQEDENLSHFALESQTTSRSLEVKAKTTVVPALLQESAAQLTGAVKWRVKTTCTSGTLKRSAYFSGSLPSQLHPRSPSVSTDDLPKTNINMLDKPDDSLPSTTPGTQNSKDVEIERHIQCFDDVTEFLGGDEVNT